MLKWYQLLSVRVLNAELPARNYGLRQYRRLEQQDHEAMESEAMARLLHGYLGPSFLKFSLVVSPWWVGMYTRNTFNDVQEVGWNFRMLHVIYWSGLLLSLANYGAVDLTAVVLLSLPVFLLLALLCLHSGVPKHAVFPMAIATLVVALALAWSFLQTSVFPGGLLGQPAWAEVRVYSLSGGSMMSLTPGDDWGSILRLTLPFGIFMLGLKLFDTDEKAVRALMFLGVSGGLIALLAIVQFQLAPRTLLFGEKRAYLDSLTGVFVNRNTAATYFGLITLLNFANLCRTLGSIEMRRLIAAIDQRRPIPSDQKRLVLVAFGYALLFLSTIVALMLTKSRAGIGASLSGILLVTFFVSLRPNEHSASQSMFARKRRSKTRRWGAGFVLFSAVAFAYLSLAGRAALRADVRGADDDRFCVFPGIVTGIVDHFPWGTGLASFAKVFPAYRNASCGIAGVWDRAHSFYLEGLFAFGVVFPLLLAGTLLPLVHIFSKGRNSRRRMRYCPELGFASLLLVAVHSIFDFSLQISGLAIVYAAMLAPIVSISLNEPLKSRRRKMQPDPTVDQDG